MKTKTLTKFNTLVDQHGREIFAYLCRVMHDFQDAEDVFQETFLRAFRAFPRLENDSNLRGWLFKIATNTAYTRLKRHNSEISHIADLIDVSLIITYDNLKQRDLIEAVLQAVNRLPYKQQAALILRNYQGFSYEEIGKALDCSPESARANVYQAVKKLRHQFSKEIK